MSTQFELHVDRPLFWIERRLSDGIAFRSARAVFPGFDFPGSEFRPLASGTPFGQFRVVAPVEFTPRQMPGSGGRRSVVVRSRRRGELRHLDGPDRRMPDGRSGGDRMRLRTEES